VHSPPGAARSAAQDYAKYYADVCNLELEASAVASTRVNDPNGPVDRDVRYLVSPRWRRPRATSARPLRPHTHPMSSRCDGRTSSGRGLLRTRTPSGDVILTGWFSSRSKCVAVAFWRKSGRRPRAGAAFAHEGCSAVRRSAGACLVPCGDVVQPQASYPQPGLLHEWLTQQQSASRSA
jgi:hypothetical protein